VVKQPLSQAAKAMRALAMHLRLSAGDEEHGQVRSLVVASATGKEGKTTGCLWLAATLAQSGLRVLLIDGDHRRGAVAARLGGCTDAGFAEVLNGTAALGGVTQHADALGIDFVGSGQPMACVSSGAGLWRLREIMGGLRGRYDFRAARLPRGGCRERRARVPGVAGGAAGRGGGEPGRLAGLAASVPPGASLAMRLVGLSFREWWRMVSPGLLASLLMLLGLGLLSPLLSGFSVPARLAASVALGAVLFPLFLCAVNRPAFRNMAEAVQALFVQSLLQGRTKVLSPLRGRLRLRRMRGA